MPDQAKIAYFQVILPTKWGSHKIKPICLHLAGTGDHVNICYNYINYIFPYCTIFFFVKSIFCIKVVFV